MSETLNVEGTAAIAERRVFSWRVLKVGGRAHAVYEPRFHRETWTAICGIGGDDGGESYVVKCKNCVRKLKLVNSLDHRPKR